MTTFKVGDHVRPIASVAKSVDGHWRRYWETEESRSDGTYYVIGLGDGGYVEYSVRADGMGPIGKAADFELVPAAAPAAGVTFKPGDKVRNSQGGWVGEVVYADEWGAQVVEGGKDWICTNDVLTLVQELKPGVRVRLTNWSAGSVGTITREHATDKGWWLADFGPGFNGHDGSSSGAEGDYWYIRASDVEILPSEPPAIISTARPAIVVLIEGGTLKPSKHPFVHASAASAATEAERLAKLNPGSTFAVFERVGARVATVSVAEVA